MGNLNNLERMALWGNELSGEIPSELGNLEALQVLWFGNNRLSGEIPSELGDLTSLRKLSLWSNELTGEIPSELVNLENLQTLYLSDNPLSGCITSGLRDVLHNDLFLLDLPFCDVLLSGLTITPGELTPQFDPYHSEYFAMVSSPHVRLVLTNEHEATIGYYDRSGYLIENAVGTLELGLELASGVTIGRFWVDSQDGQASYSASYYYTLEIRRVPASPIISGVTPGAGYLNVSWTAPDETGGADITSYDLRYIESNTADKSDANWTVIEGVWTSAVGGSLKYALTGLTGDTPYDIQVRAVNGAGGMGFWSTTVPGTPLPPSVCVAGGAVADPTNIELVSDCEALLVIGDILAGTASLNWAADTPITDWDGIRTLEGTPERVTRLYLHGKRLNGTIPAELAFLTDLTHLYLHKNQLNGEIPAELGKLANLEWLSLYSNRLTGGIPSTFADLSNLKRMYLNHNQLSGTIPSELGGMPSLTHLFLHRNDLTGGIPPELGDMTNLAWLSLYSNELTGGIPAELGRLPKLKRLYLHANPLGGEIPAQLGDLSSLTHLLLLRNDLSGPIPAELGKLSNLVWLALYDNELSSEIPSELGMLSNLRRLYLHYNRLDGEIPGDLGNLTDLTNLWLKNNNLSGEIPDALNSLTHLERVRISGNEFTGCIPSGLTDDEELGRTSDAEALGLPVCADS